MALDGVLKLSLYLSLFVRNCPLKCPRRNLQNETYCYGQAQTKTPETLVVSGVLQVSGINSALGELRCATSGLQAVLLLFLRPQTVGITGFAASSALG